MLNKVYILLLIIILQLIVIVSFEILPTYNLNSATRLLKADFSEENLIHWTNSFNNSGLTSTQSTSDVESLGIYKSLIDEYNSKAIYDLESLEISKIEPKEVKIPFATEKKVSENLPDKVIIVKQKGTEGINIHSILKVESHELLVAENISKEPVGKIQIVGKLKNDDFEKKLAKLINNSNYEITKVSYPKIKESNVAGISVKNLSCNSNFDLTVTYDIKADSVSIPGFNEIANTNCFTATVSQTTLQTPSQTDSKVITLGCSNCELAPVDKTSALPSNYVPSLVPITIAGGGYVTSATNIALGNMNQGAISAGTSIVINSAYRSYVTQQNTFNSWVSRELAKGKSYNDAVASANFYSALPGQSEHQLGTTLDVSCPGCTAFSKAQNPLYIFLQNNAHKYGFVISYPQGKEHLTGYTYEPWHIRYIGVGLATELYNRGYLNTGNSEYLSSFLREKKLY